VILAGRHPGQTCKLCRHALVRSPPMVLKKPQIRGRWDFFNTIHGPRTRMRAGLPMRRSARRPRHSGLARQYRHGWAVLRSRRRPDRHLPTPRQRDKRKRPGCNVPGLRPRSPVRVVSVILPAASLWSNRRRQPRRTESPPVRAVAARSLRSSATASTHRSG